MIERLDRFFFTPAAERPLVALRVVMGLILFAQAVAVAPLANEFWSANGLMQTSLGDYLTGGDVLWFSGLRGLVRLIGVPEGLWIRTLFAAYVGSLVALVAIPKRASAIAACLLHCLLMAGGNLQSYGVDAFSQMALFILVLCPGRAGQVSEEARFALRTFQITLMLAYMSSGISKARGIDWYTGDAVYRALTMPLYQAFDTRFLVEWPWIAKLMCWFTLVLEVGYPAILGWRKTRMAGVVAIAGLHIGIGLGMRLESFATLMTLLTVCAFGIRAEPHEAVYDGRRGADGNAA